MRGDTIGRRLRALGRGIGILLLPLALILLTIPLFIGHIILFLLSIVGWMIGILDIVIELITGRPSHLGQGIQDWILNTFRSINDWYLRKIRWFWTGEISLTG